MEKTVSSILMSINLLPVGAINSSVLSGTGISLIFASDIVCFDGSITTSSTEVPLPLPTMSAKTLTNRNFFLAWWSFSFLISTLTLFTNVCSTFHSDLNTLLPPENVQVTVKQFHRC